MENYKEGIREHHNKHVDALVHGSVDQSKLELVSRYLSGKERVLDIGCGNGNYTIPIAEKAGSVLGIDFSEGMVADLRKRIEADGIRNIEARLGDFFEVPLEPESFDLAVSFSTLYYVKEIYPLFEKVRKCLKPGGRFIFDVANASSIGGVFYSRKYKIYQNFLSMREFGRKVKEIGFEIEGEKCFELIPRFSILRGVLDARVGGATVDQAISNLPLANALSFRHLFVLRKG